MTCRPDASLGQVARMLAERRVHSLFVVDRNNKPIGVITDYDLMAGEWLSGDAESLIAMRGMTAGELMSSPVETINADDKASEAAKRMREDGIRRLLVCDKGKPVGVISISNFLVVLAESATIGRDTVGDVMSDVYLVCRDKTSVKMVARALTETGWRSVLVVDACGKPLGVFSGLDLLAYDDIQKIPDDKPVTDLMHSFLTISMDANLQEAARMMIENRHHRLLVVDPDQPDCLPLGIISSFDIVVEMARPDSVWQK
jgi:CBS domain-containing protein